jgi:hypothetical protein
MKPWLLPNRHMLFLFPLALMLATGSAFSQTTASDAKKFEAGVDASALALGEHHQFKDKSAQYHRRLAEFVAGNMMFVVLHEMAHAVISEMGIPILAREEDVADSFAATRLIKIQSGISDRVLTEAAQGFFTSNRRDKKEGNAILYYDDHGLDLVRAYRIVCLMVGSDKDKYKQLAAEAKLPEDQWADCVGDYGRTAHAWDVVLNPHVRGPDRPRTKIDVIYRDAKDELEIHARAFRSIQLLEIIADHAADQFVWSAPFTLEMQSCGFINAQWVAKTRTLTLCYELAADFADLYDNYGTGDIP